MKFDQTIELIIREKGGEVFSIAADAMVYEALVKMSEKRIGALVVLDGSDLVGIFSERDYARKVILAGRSSKVMKVREIMSSPVKTVTVHSTIDECMQAMSARRCRHLPVVDGDKLLGMVSIGDVVSWIIKAQDRAIHDLEDYISGDYPG